MNNTEKKKRYVGSRAVRVALTTSALIAVLSLIPNRGYAEGEELTPPAAEGENLTNSNQEGLSLTSDAPSVLSSSETTEETSQTTPTEAQENVVSSPQPEDSEGNPLTQDKVEVVTPVQQPDETAKVTVDEVTITESVDGEGAPVSETSSAVTLKNVQDAVIQSTVDKLELLVSGFNTITSLKSTGSVNISGSGLLLVDEIAVNGLTLKQTGYDIGETGTAAVSTRTRIPAIPCSTPLPIPVFWAGNLPCPPAMNLSLATAQSCGWWPAQRLPLTRRITEKWMRISLRAI